MSIQALIEQLTRLEREVDVLSKDRRRSSLGAADRPRAPTAEYVAKEAMPEDAGSVLDALVRLRQVHEAYWRVFLTDQRETLNALMQSRSPVDVLRVGVEHWRRRATHAADGVRQTFVVLASTGRSLTKRPLYRDTATHR